MNGECASRRRIGQRWGLPSRGRTRLPDPATLASLAGLAALAALFPASASPQDAAQGELEVDARPAPDAPAPPPAPAAAPAAAASGTTARLNQERADPRRLLPHYEFLEDNYLDYFFPKVGPVNDRPLIFEAQAAAHLFLVNQWWKVYEPLAVGDWRFVNSLAVTFVLHLRMVQEHSAPVRPPSYIPRLDYQLFGVHRTSPDQLVLTELRLTPWGHHSNGQQDCPFAEPSSVADGVPVQCVGNPDPVHNPPIGFVNYRTGDFSTSYFTVGGHVARIALDEERYTRWRSGIGFLFEGNPPNWGPGTRSEETAQMYGVWRAKGEGELRVHLDLRSWLTGMVSLTGSAEAMWPVANGIPGDREIVELAYQPDVFRGMGGFVRWFSGQDDLNLLYAAGRTTKVVVGIIWSASPQLQYTFGER
jgi:hypothetical protein